VIELFPFTKSVLIVGHPVHAVQIYGWLEIIKPATMHALTDGSRPSGGTRLEPVIELMDQMNVQRGAVYGRYTDRDIYAAILRRDYGFFISLTEEITAELIRKKTQFVFGDAAEYYNPVHDVCRMIIGAAVEIANKSEGLQIQNYDFLLMAPHTNHAESPGRKFFSRTLSDVQLEEKFSFARRTYPEFADETRRLFEGKPVESYRTESLRPCGNRSGYDKLADVKPFYEKYGEGQVAKGFYKRVLRFEEDMAPLGEALWDFVEKTKVPS